MAIITYIEFNSCEHRVDVPIGLSVMRGAVDNNIPGIDGRLWRRMRLPPRATSMSMRHGSA